MYRSDSGHARRCAAPAESVSPPSHCEQQKTSLLIS
jgi:hypothetical protein